MKLSELKEVVEIDLSIPQGLRWLVDRKSNKVKGLPSGYLRRNTYFYSHIDGNMLLNHRIIYALHHNLELDELPKYIDHIDGNKLNNNPSNLRPCTIQENNRNRKLQKNNTSGYTGVYVDNRNPHKKYQASIRVDKKNVSLGYFSSAYDASIAYQEAAKRIFGEFYSEGRK